MMSNEENNLVQNPQKQSGDNSGQQKVKIFDFADYLAIGGNSGSHLSPNKMWEITEAIKVLVSKNASGVTHTQICRVHTILMACKGKDVQEIFKTRYKLSYLIARQGKVKTAVNLIGFVQGLIEQLGRTAEKERPFAMESFFTVLEAIVAYHKFYGKD